MNKFDIKIKNQIQYDQHFIQLILQIIQSKKDMLYIKLTIFIVKIYNYNINGILNSIINLIYKIKENQYKK